MSSKQLDKELLHKLYWKDNKGIKTIAKELSINPRHVSAEMKRYGIKTRQEVLQERLEELTKENLEELYFKQDMTLQDIADLYECHVQTIERKMHGYGLKPNKLGGPKRINITKEELFKRYYDDDETIASIAKDIGCNETHLYDVLKRYGRKSKEAELHELIDENTLRRLYIDENKTQLEIAEIFNLKTVKTIQTLLNRYNIEKNKDAIVQTREQTSLKNYGVKNPSSSKEIREKVKATNLERYGCENQFQSEEIKERIRRTNLEKYGVEHTIQRHIHNIDDWNNFEEFVKQQYEKQQSLLSIVFLSEYFGTHASAIYRKIHQYQLEEYCDDNTSLPEQSWEQWLQDNNIRYDKHNRSLISPQEVDFVLLDLSMALEINPSATHNSTFAIFPNKLPLKTTYHKNKSLAVEAQGLNLIHVFDWYDEEKIKEIILTKNGKSKRIYARNTKVQEIEDKNIEKDFLDKTHLQGYIKSQICLGLYYENELISIMSFGKPRYGNKEKVDYEMLRFATLNNYQVIGGASKLFKYFVNNFKVNKIISYCNFDISNGNLYEKLGFDFIRYTNPSYEWCHFRLPIHYSWYLITTKGVDNVLGTNYGKGESNEELMKKEGFVKVYNSGNKVFVWNRKKF